MTDAELARYAEKLFFDNQNDLIKYSQSVFATDKSVERIEGEDINRGFVIPNVLGNVGTYTHRTGTRAEVKAARHFLNRNGKWSQGEVDESGVLGFEIFGIWKDDRSQPYAGWTLALFNPEQLRQIKALHHDQTKVEEIDTLSFILFDDNENPFACIAFENINQLKKKLCECFPSEWNFEYYNLPSLADKRYWKTYIDDGGKCNKWDKIKGGMIKNMWYIPFNYLKGIATVTMIGDHDPIIQGDSNEVSEATQKKILEGLSERARDVTKKSSNGEIIEYSERRLTTEKQNENQIARKNKRTPITFYIPKQIADSAEDIKE